MRNGVRFPESLLNSYKMVRKMVNEFIKVNPNKAKFNLRRGVKGDEKPLNVSCTMPTDKPDEMVEIGGEFDLMAVLKNEAIKVWLSRDELREVQAAITEELVKRLETNQYAS